MSPYKVKNPVSDPFQATLDWLWGFRFVWEQEPVCCFCKKPIRPNETIRWGQSSAPNTIRHIACEREWAESHRP